MTLKQSPTTGAVTYIDAGGITRVYPPGSDLSAIDSEVAAQITAMFTPEATAAYARYIAAAEAHRPPDPPRSDMVRAETTRRIYAVAQPHTQMNMTGARAAGLFDAGQEAAYAASVQWVANMRAACAAIIANPALDPFDDANWPKCPDNAKALAAAF